MRIINLDTHVRDESDQYEAFYFADPKISKKENRSGYIETFYLINVSLKNKSSIGDHVFLRFNEYEIVEILEERKPLGTLGGRKHTYQRLKTKLVQH